MNTSRHCSTGILALLVFTAVAGCSSRAYQANTAIPASKYPAAIDRAKKSKWYMVLHSGINAYSITSVQVDRSKKQATVQLDKVDSLYLAFNGMAGVPVKGSSPRRAAMHVYTSDSASYTLDEPHTIMLDKVAKMERVE